MTAVLLTILLRWRTEMKYVKNSPPANQWHIVPY